MVTVARLFSGWAGERHSELEALQPAALDEYLDFAAHTIVADAVVPPRAPRALPRADVPAAAVANTREDSWWGSLSTELADALTRLQGDTAAAPRIGRPLAPSGAGGGDASWQAWRAARTTAPAPMEEAAVDDPNDGGGGVGEGHPSALYTHYSYNSWFAPDRPIAQRSPAGLADAVLPTPLSRPEIPTATSELHRAYAELLAVAAWRAGVPAETLHRVVHRHELRLMRLLARSQR